MHILANWMPGPQKCNGLLVSPVYRSSLHTKRGVLGLNFGQKTDGLCYTSLMIILRASIIPR